MACLVERPERFECCDDPISSVKAAAGRHRVGVGSDKQPWSGGPRLSTEDVVDLVGARLQARRLQSPAQPEARLDVGWRSGDSVHTAVCPAADERKVT